MRSNDFGIGIGTMNCVGWNGMVMATRLDWTGVMVDEHNVYSGRGWEGWWVVAAWPFDDLVGT